MKKRFLKLAENIIKTTNPTIDNDDIEVITYGLESIYLTITKLIIILISAVILGITKEFVLLLIFYNVIRSTAFGMHASKSSHCLISSIIFLIGGVYVCKFIKLSLIAKAVTCLFCIICVYKYAPADTHKRPLVNEHKRLVYKVISLMSTFVFSILIVMFNENIISNFLLLGMLEATLMILPITYRLFKMPYANYKNYGYSFKNIT